MCGITGIAGFEDKNLVKRMAGVLVHRGPDDHGYFSDANVCLGHRRLSIIDIKGGKQPMQGGFSWIVYNGELYNYRELRAELEKKHSFATDSDTEVVVRAYEEYGEKCVEKFNGMFAFAIWDPKRKSLFLARDRLGIKPLYYALVNGSLIFSSEIKGLLQYPELKRRINRKAVYDYLSFRYVPGPETILDGVKKLLPAHTLTFKAGKLSMKRYWNFKMSPAEKPEAHYSEEILNLLQDSVKMRLMSDVPLGAYLSGGLDSSFIVGLMSRVMDEPVKTFSVGFGYEDVDELKHAKIVSEHFSTEHREIMVKPEAAKIIPKVVWHLDEPISDAAAIPTYLMSEVTKKRVTVVLTGEGGDELFAGYGKYKIMRNYERYKKFVPGFVRSTIIPSVAEAFLGSDLSKRVKEYASSMEDADRNYLTLISVFSEKEKEKLLQKFPKTRSSVGLVSPHIPRKTKDLLGNILSLDTKTWLPDDLLMKVDKMTMAHAVEARVPLLDHRMVELASRIPTELKLRGGSEKYILRKAMVEVVPREIRRRKKHDFRVPVTQWLQKDLREVASHVLSEENLRKRGYFSIPYVRNILKPHKKHQDYYRRQFWNLFVLELWQRLYIDQEDLSKPKLTMKELY